MIRAICAGPRAPAGYTQLNGGPARRAVKNKIYGRKCSSETAIGRSCAPRVSTRQQRTVGRNFAMLQYVAKVGPHVVPRFRHNRVLSCPPFSLFPVLLLVSCHSAPVASSSHFLYSHSFVQFRMWLALRRHTDTSPGTPPGPWPSPKLHPRELWVLGVGVVRYQCLAIFPFALGAVVLWLLLSLATCGC